MSAPSFLAVIAADTLVAAAVTLRPTLDTGTPS